VRANRDRFQIVGLAAGGADPVKLAEQAAEFGVPALAVADPEGGARLSSALSALDHKADIGLGSEGVSALAGRPANVVLNGITGSIGLAPTLAALDAGSTLALANKESLIVGGPLVRDRAAPGQIVPVDSEHSALAQCLRGGRSQEVERLILTASGGPFRGKARHELEHVTVAEALAHPTWNMGPVVTINSATMMNKALEVIEAHLLFDVALSSIDVVVHPQSVVHSMVQFVDGSTILQASPPDMRLPIALGLAWPERVAGAASACDWSDAAQWDFQPLDEEVFGAVRIARTAAEAGGCAPAVFNAANEECVSAFLAGRIAFPKIITTVEQALTDHLRQSGGLQQPVTIDDVLSAETWARTRAAELLEDHR
jgi:1-deoxy-D-xylulose-5-phosphate reductoisomerase